MTAFTAFAFEDTIENWGEAVKLGMFRAQSFKLVNCAVTGSSDGTSRDPKRSFQRIFEYSIFPAVRKLMAVGGRYEGYTLVCQGDGAGPHVEAAFLDFI